MTKAAEQPVLHGTEQCEKPEDSMTALIKRCVLDPAIDATKLSVLLDAQLRWEANESRKKFEAAYEQFKRQLPDIFRTKKVTIATKGGDVIEYSHAELDKITPIITESLLAVGIVHQWRTGPNPNGAGVVVTCVLKGFGHTEEAASIPGPPDVSGAKSSSQAIQSTITSLERYSLLAACGIAVKGSDNDGRTSDGGLSEQALEAFLIKIKDSSSADEGLKAFQEAWKTADDLNDKSSRDRIRKVWETKKKELAGAHRG